MFVADFITGTMSAHCGASPLCLTATASSLSSDLSELQLQTPRDAQRQGGARLPGRRSPASRHSRWRRRRRRPRHAAATRPSPSLPGGDEPASPAGVRTPLTPCGCLIKCLSCSATKPPPARLPPTDPLRASGPPPLQPPSPPGTGSICWNVLQTEWCRPLIGGKTDKQQTACFTRIFISPAD